MKIPHFYDEKYIRKPTAVSKTQIFLIKKNTHKEKYVNIYTYIFVNVII